VAGGKGFPVQGCSRFDVARAAEGTAAAERASAEAARTRAGARIGWENARD